MGSANVPFADRPCPLDPIRRVHSGLTAEVLGYLVPFLRLRDGKRTGNEEGGRSTGPPQVDAPISLIKDLEPPVPVGRCESSKVPGYSTCR